MSPLNDIICVLDAISAANPRVIDDARARKLSNDLKRSTYYETCSTYGLNVERVFQDGEMSDVLTSVSEHTFSVYAVLRVYHPGSQDDNIPCSSRPLLINMDQ